MDEPGNIVGGAYTASLHHAEDRRKREETLYGESGQGKVFIENCNAYLKGPDGNEFDVCKIEFAPEAVSTLPHYKFPEVTIRDCHFHSYDANTYLVYFMIAGKRKCQTSTKAPSNVTGHCRDTGNENTGHLFCGQNYQHSRRKAKRIMNYWICGTKKKKGGRCPATGMLDHDTLERVSAEVLGLSSFDGDVFLEKVDFINVPARNVLEFHMKDGGVVTKDCPPPGRRKR